MNRYKLTHQPREYLSHNIYKGQKFYLVKDDFPLKYMYSDVIMADFIEDELFFYVTLKPLRKLHTNSMKLPDLEKHYTLEDGTPYDEGLRR